MLKILTIVFCSVAALITFSLNNEDSRETISNQEEIKQEFIILDSADDGFFEEQNINYMEQTGKPAAIPNFDLNQPVVITKMPLIQKENESGIN